MADEADISQAESDFLLSVILRKRAQYQGESAEYCTGCGAGDPGCPPPGTAGCAVLCFLCGTP